ncbi:MAG: aldo/keto reductase [Clostridiales bacterium]|jgi:aryl-alcohol dehydrogenase-like predicted oxidoreductase|nr:aldo/keto reductase [Eubacteriales bacterium]MDH7566588.1 aldo/keto reductase [Clostridiales bacterium]
MDKIVLGRTNLLASRVGFGCIPIQRISFDDARHLLRKAYNSGINFFDTARAYSDSEEKIGYALADVRKEIIIATKTMAKDKNTLLEHLDTSLKNLKTDYIDIYQLHAPEYMPRPDGPDELYDTLINAKKAGKIRFIGITNHKLEIAKEAAQSNLYDTVQFPLSSLSSEDDLELVEICRQNNVGLIAMKALAGGLITKASSAFSFLWQYDNVVPIWGIQKEPELDEFLDLAKNPPVLDEEMMKIIENDRVELSGAFCRGCGYCMPCPAGIPIPMAARISLLLRRAPYQPYLEDEWKEKMELISGCLECGQCKSKCPYELDTPNLLKRMLGEYREFYAAHKK